LSNGRHARAAFQHSALASNSSSANRFVTENVAEEARIALPKLEQDPDALARKAWRLYELQQWLAWLEDYDDLQYRTLWTLAVNIGPRVSEAAALQWHDISTLTDSACGFVASWSSKDAPSQSSSRHASAR